VIVSALPAGSVSSCHREPSESDVVDDHIGLSEYEVGTVARTGVHVRTRQMKHAGTTGGGETVRSSAGSGELSTGRSSTEMISDRRSDTNCKVLIKGVN